MNAKQPQTKADALQRSRLRLGKSQEDMAAALNCHRTTYCNWENGKHEPPDRIMFQMACYLDRPVIVHRVYPPRTRKQRKA